MKRVSVWLLITVTTIVVLYFIITRNGLPIISINNVESISINSPGGIKQYTIKNDSDEIENFISMYNKAKRIYHDWDTTPEIIIVFQLKDGKEISIQGNSQTYQFVFVNGKHYRISGKELTSYMRSFYGRFHEK